MDIPDPDELVTFERGPDAGREVVLHRLQQPAAWSGHAKLAEQTLTTRPRQALYNHIQDQSASDAFMAFLYYSPYAYATTPRCTASSSRRSATTTSRTRG